jgi:hypothetical protein
MGGVRDQKNRLELRDGKPEPVNVLERIAYQVGIYKIEKESQDDNRGNPDFAWEIPGKKDRPSVYEKYLIFPIRWGWLTGRTERRDSIGLGILVSLI